MEEISKIFRLRSSFFSSCDSGCDTDDDDCDYCGCEDDDRCDDNCDYCGAKDDEPSDDCGSEEYS